MNGHRIYLVRSSDGELTEGALFTQISDEHLLHWDKEWVPAFRSHRQEPNLQIPEDAHWDWRAKATYWRPLLGYKSFAVMCEYQLQGLMVTNDVSSAKLSQQFGKPMVYVEFVATAPWNRPSFESPPRFRGTGRILIWAAVELSFASGFKGRVGLHALPNAESFYESKCGFTRLGRDSSHQNLTYFELSENNAEAFFHNQV